MNYITLFAQTTTSKVDPGEAAAASAVFAGFGIVMLLFCLVLVGVAIACFVFWVIALIHVLQHQDVKDRVMWIVILFVAGTIAGVIYFFAVKRPYDRGGMRETPSVQPPLQ